MDLVNGGYRIIGGPPETREIAWEWVRQKEKEQETRRAGGVTFNIGNIGNAVGIGVFGDNANINATQALSLGELLNSVKRLVDQTELALRGSDLPDTIKAEADAALGELRTAATQDQVDGLRLKHGLLALRNVMEHAAGHVIAVGVVGLIDKILALWPG